MVKKISQGMAQKLLAALKAVVSDLHAAQPSSFDSYEAAEQHQEPESLEQAEKIISQIEGGK
jgi:hypothetical protein